MTVTLGELAFFAGGLFLLFLTPGPVWVALVARVLRGGFGAAWPLALGVVIGDVLWCFLAITGLSWLVAQYAGAMEALRWIAAVVFIAMGVMILRSDQHALDSDSRLTRPGFWGGFSAGLLVIIGNPKAIVFYMGILPGFFDLSSLTAIDIILVCGLAAAVPFVGNLALAAFVGRVRDLIRSPQALRRMNITAGILLIAVGLAIPLL